MTSVLMVFLFFGLISMILPSSFKTNWIYLLLLLVLFSSLLGSFVNLDLDLSLTKGEQPDFETALPESAVLHSVVSARVKELTGEAPVTVESDLSRNEDVYRLAKIHVVIKSGKAEEVQDALEKTFSFPGFVVTSLETP